MNFRRTALVPALSSTLWLILLIFPPAAIAAEPLFVESAAGSVKIRQADAWESPYAGLMVKLPAVVSTGSDGSILLRQGETAIAVAANSALELYEGPAGHTLQRVVQDRGSVFYDIAPGGDKRLRVETPFLVAVIKGTEFNVTVSPEVSTVALFEGRLQIEAPDVGDVVDLLEGHIARRHRNDPRITVIRMEDGEPVARPATVGDSGRSPNDPSAAGSRRDVDGGDAFGDMPRGDPADDGRVDNGREAGTGVVIDGGTGVTRVGADVILDDVADVSIDVGVAISDGKLGAEFTGTADTGLARIDAGVDAGVDLAGAEVALDTSVGAELGDATLDAGLDAGVDLAGAEVALDTSIGAELGDASLDTGLDAGDGAIDVAIDVETELAGDHLDVGVDLGLDLDSGLDSILDLELDLDDPLDEEETEDEPADITPIPDILDRLGL